MASSQQPYSKNRAQLDLLLLGHVQPPDCDNWDDQNHEVAHNIDDASADDYGVLIEAILSPCNFIGFADAFGYDCEDKSDRVEKVPVEDEPDARRGIKISFSTPSLAKGGTEGRL